MGTFHLKIGRQILKFATLSMKRKKGEFMRRKNQLIQSTISLLYKFATFYRLTVMFQKLAPCRHEKSLIMDDKYQYFCILVVNSSMFLLQAKRCCQSYTEEIIRK